LVCDNVNILGGQEVYAQGTENVFVSCHKNAGQKWSTKVANNAFENVAKFKYLGVTVTNQNYIHKEIRSRLNLLGMLATIQHRILCLSYLNA